MASYQNCWEFFTCGREPGGANRLTCGPCPAATEASLIGPNDGRHSGRICWMIDGTHCGGVVRGLASEKANNCYACAFFKSLVLAAEQQMVG